MPRNARQAATAASANNARGTGHDPTPAPTGSPRNSPLNTVPSGTSIQVSVEAPHRAAAASVSNTTTIHSGRLSDSRTGLGRLRRGHGVRRGHGRQHGPRLVEGFVVLVVGVGVGHDTGSG